MNDTILLVLTGHADLGGVRDTGYYVGEAAEPWTVFRQAGYRVDIARAGTAIPRPDGYDPASPAQQRFCAEVDRADPPLVSDLDVTGYAAVFFVGGHGTMWDFPGLGGLVTRAYAAGVVIAAVCHGSAVLRDAQAPDGGPLSAGRAVTGFSDAEEAAVGLTEAVPFSLETALRDAGARYSCAEPFAPHVEVDGRLVTGQNPASAHETAHAVLDVLSTASGDLADGRVWLITGANTGIGAAMVRRALTDGDRVVAGARDVETLRTVADANPGRFVATRVDVTDVRTVRAAVTAALSEFGRIDVLVNNAGYGLRGATEEWDVDRLRAQFDVNVFGAVDVTRAVLPVMRSQASGHIVQLSSVGGVTVAVGGTAYAASKFALEGLSEGLASEVAPLGINVTIVEPGPFRTEFAGRSTDWSPQLPAYRDILDGPYRAFRAQDGEQPGDPDRAAAVIAEVTRMAEPPLRLPLGPQAFDRIAATLRSRLDALPELEKLGRDTGFGPVRR